MAHASPQSCWEYSMPWYAWVIYLVPVMSVVWAWAMAHKNLPAKGPKLASLIALTFCTASALSAACGTMYLVYFTCVPSSTEWTALPEYRLDGYVILFSLISLVGCSVALMRGESRRLCRTVLLTSAWTFFFSFVHGMTI
jgi:hypothetical protein